MIDVLSSTDLRYQDYGKHRQVRDVLRRRAAGVGSVFVCLSFAVYMVDIAAAAQRSQADDGQRIAKVVDEFFAAEPDYRDGDLIRRSQIEQMVAKLLGKGVKISEPASIVKLGLPDDSFLVRELSTPAGKNFMRRLAQHPGGYSYLDRLSTIPRGQTTVRDLIRQKDGDKMIEYIATTKGGRNLSAQMAQPRGGVDLNKPTGRIYTAEDLIDALNNAIKKTKP